MEDSKEYKVSGGSTLKHVHGPGVDVVGADCAVVSYPRFWRDARALGGSVDGVDAGTDA